MAAIPRERLTRHLPAAVAVGLGAVAALAALVMPAAWLEAASDASGLADLLPAAAPPLGLTARAVLALGGGLTVAAVGWAALFLLIGPGGLLTSRRGAAGVPSVRRADAHPDAPPRRPFSIAEMGEPAPIGPALAVSAAPVEPERAVPVDLDTPLAALDPAAIPAVPMPPVRALAPLAPGERLSTFALAPRPARAPAPAEPPSIEALLRRLEQGAERRALAR